MADGANEETVGNDKSEVKTDKAPSTESEEGAEKGGTVDSPDASENEDKIPEAEKSPNKGEKSAKKEKNVKKEERKDDSDDENDEDDDEEELPPGLLELPLEVEGKREKKKVERLSASMIRSPQEKKKLEIEEGSGMKLGDIPFVEHQINIAKPADLKPLHRVLFLRAGANAEIKKNIKQFSGFTHSKDSKEHEKRVASLNKMVTAELKSICLVLGLERSGAKGSLVDRVITFLMEPEDKGLTLKSKGKKRSKATGGKPKTAKKKKSKESGKKGKADKDDISASDSEEIEKEDGEEVEEEEEEEEEEEAEDSEDEVPKKKKAKTDSKKKAPKKSVNENGKKEKVAPKKETKTPTPNKRPVVENDSLSEDTEEEPVAKMKSPPSNEEIKALVEKLLDGADLETVTMKTVMKQVYDNYPSFDLSDRKDFIKETVRKIIT